MIELALIKSLFNKINYDKYSQLINPKVLSRETKQIIKDIVIYYEKTSEDIDFKDFRSWYFVVQHPNMDEKAVDEYKDIFDKIEQETLENTQQIILEFERQEFYLDLQESLDDNIEIEDLSSKLSEFLLKNNANNQTLIAENMDLLSALSASNRQDGLRWRCKALDDHFEGGLIRGDFGVIAASVDAGKSSFIASELGYMAQQLKDNEYILWLSNEGEWTSILPRLYCSVLNCTRKRLEKDKESAIIEYTKRMHGDPSRVQIIDIQGWTAKNIEQTIKTKTPRLVAIDLVDNINGFDKYSNKESATEKYGKLYQWCREIATKYCPVLGVTQLNAEGANKMYPRLENLRMSQIDKQGACTFALMIGSLPNDPYTRYFSMPKNKVNTNKTWKAIVKFNPNKSIFT